MAAEDYNEAFGDLAKVQLEVIDVLRRAAEARARAAGVLPEVLTPDVVEPLVEAPLEAILREMLLSGEQAVVDREQAVVDREQVARLVVLLDRINTKVDGLEEAATAVADNLAASQHRADSVQGDPGAAADAGIQSPRAV